MQDKLPGPPLSAAVGAYLPDARQATIQITNDGAKTATAWSLQIICRYADGPATMVIRDEDFYQLLIVPAPDGHGPLAPGKIAETVISFADGRVPSAVEVTPLAVVYDDQTADGTQQRLDKIFTRRAKEFAAAQEVMSQLRALLQTGVSRSTLQTLKTSLVEVPVQSPGDSIRRLAANNIDAILSRTPDTPAGLVQPTTELLDLLTRYERGAQQHSRRR